MTWRILKLWRKARGHPLHAVCYHRSPRLRLPCLRWPTYDYRCARHQDGWRERYADEMVKRLKGYSA